MATSDELEDERMESLRYLFLYFQKRFVIPPLPVGEGRGEGTLLKGG